MFNPPPTHGNPDSPLADPLEGADEECVDGDEASGVRRLDVALAELGGEALQQPGLLLRQLDQAFGGGLLQPQQALVLGEEVVALPDAAHAAGGDLEALQPQFLFDPERAMAGMGEGVIEDRGLDLGRDPVRVRTLGAGQPVDQPLGAIGLEVAADLVELLARVAHHLAGAGNVGQLARQFEQRELATCYLVLAGHGRVPVSSRAFGDTIKPARKRPGHRNGALGLLRSAPCSVGGLCQVTTISGQKVRRE